MATRMGNTSLDGSSSDSPRSIPPCSICEGNMVLAYDRYQQKVCVCTDCHTSITIPGGAWRIASLKRAAKAQGCVIIERRRAGRRASDVRIES
jgi:hypothetical protein